MEKKGQEKIETLEEYIGCRKQGTEGEIERKMGKDKCSTREERIIVSV